MIVTNLNEFRPDWISPPGDTIEDLMEEQGLSIEDLAFQLKKKVPFIKLLLAGLTPIDEELAIELSKTLGSTSGFWMSRESHFRNRILEIESDSKG